ncbi:MAG TPA: hypothetical protein VFW11_19955 [Cyclobacteriaceae bacterium]|nr:hypothetical protein [Cyclobacteriaceae bacterium]
MKNLMIVFLLVAPLSLVTCDDDDEVLPENPGDMPYNVTINPDDFVSINIVGNLFFPLATGSLLTYEGVDEDGSPVRVVTEWTTGTKTIAGVTCVITHDQSYINDELAEDTFDWYAQDQNGNIWYFGEDTKEIENGNVTSTEGSWEAGVDGALPGIIMFANPIPGVWNRQEYYENVAEDVGQILDTNVSVTVPFGNFDNCLQTAEWNLNEPGIVEHKFYAPGIGLIKTITVKGKPSNEELVQIQ